MNLELKITMADPAGNRTAFVEGMVEPEHYAAVGAALLKEGDLKAEQAGFSCPPRFGSAGRLEMMGGEFCGNAARSFGMWLGMRLGKKAGDTIPIEVSGSSSVLEVLLEENGAWISMPLPEQMIEIAVPDEENSGSFLHFPAVVLEGITHVILENTPPSNSLARSVIEEAARKTKAEAAGAIFVNPDLMTPAVWVRATDSFVWESSCGSGTLAAAAWLGRGVKSGVFRQELQQPGGILKAELTVQNSTIIDARIGGPVFFEEPVVKNITL